LSKIDKIISRFTIAFSYKYEKESAYQRACDQIEKLRDPFSKNIPVWTPVDYGEKDSELFTHVQKFLNRDLQYSDESIGCAWAWNKELLKDFSYSGSCTINNKAYPFSINSAGLFLFKTGIGILWYEIGYQVEDVDTVISINWRLKDIAYSD
jgi:hypothetical protein